MAAPAGYHAQQKFELDGVSRSHIVGRTKADKKLLLAARNFDVDRLKAALQDAGISSIDVRDVKDNEHYTALHWAVLNCWVEGVKILLETGAQPHALSGRQRTPGDLILGGTGRFDGTYADDRIAIARLLKQHGHPRIDVTQSSYATDDYLSAIPEIAQVVQAINSWDAL
ncbi:MAG: hypothetical protein P4L81_00245 [Candidatus Pacebacteria bacterium]|nr:hypothetical protein [Candidatus Paceibacterota bacterium]